MKPTLTLAVLLVAAVASRVESVPAIGGGLNFMNGELGEYESAEVGVRQRRVLCDLMSPNGGVIGSTACAANCLSMGKAGGSCFEGICRCRRTTFKELWNKRFGTQISIKSTREN